jgi:hypothetical protein
MRRLAWGEGRSTSDYNCDAACFKMVLDSVFFVTANVEKAAQICVPDTFLLTGAAG